MKRTLLINIILLFALEPKAQPKIDGRDYIKALKHVTDIMVNDATSPVAASRYYAYMNLSGYECVSYQSKNGYVSFSGELNDFKLDKSNNFDSFDHSLASILSVYIAAKTFLPSGSLINKQIDSLENLCNKLNCKSYYQNSLSLAKYIVTQVYEYSKKDGFKILSGLQKYLPLKGPGFWKPTPPIYMASIEPYWGTLRTFLVDSSKQFQPLKPIEYNEDSLSEFYALTKEVYEYGKHANKEEQEIAEFWDCNPFAVEQIGHVEIGIKKISPGGHWLGITGIACIQKKMTIEKTILVHTLVSITLADAFITCWQEKYTSNRIRPVTVINRLIDPLWQPLLQTPPFPEYVSGHSVASTAASVLLTKIFGENFHFSDNTEVEFNLPVRKFKSFHSAAEEASISRLYGGIHFRDGIVEGVKLGNEVGKYALKKLSSHLN